MINKILKHFSPLLFLVPLGAGGLTIAIFALFNYTLPHGKGLIYISQVHSMHLPILKMYTVYGLEALMAIFAIIHVLLSIAFFTANRKWQKTDKYKEVHDNPIVNGGLMASFVSIAMTLNVFIAVVRYFVPYIAQHLQSLMLPGLIAWAIVWLLTMAKEVELLKLSLTKDFDMSKLHFGWLLHPLALGMVTVTGTGIAALAHSAPIAHTAAFMSLITGTMGAMLLNVKLNALFTQHIAKDGMPDNQLLPSMLIVVPNMTVFAISAFRLGHYMEHQFGAEMGMFLPMVMMIGLAFEIWYLAFGISMLSDFAKTYLKTHFHVTQWGLICPFVAFAVLGAFVFKLALPVAPAFWFLVALILATSALYIYLLRRQCKCIRDEAKGFVCD